MTKLFFEMMNDDELTAFEKCICHFLYLFDNDDKKEGLEMDYICGSFWEKRKIKREVIERVVERLVYKGQVYSTVNEYTFRFIGSKVTANRKAEEAKKLRAAREAQEKKDLEEAGYASTDLVKYKGEDAGFGIGPNPKPKPKEIKKEV